VKPEQVVDWLSLMGDAVDNIPGVRGGPKTAADLLGQLHTGNLYSVWRSAVGRTAWAADGCGGFGAAECRDGPPADDLPCEFSPADYLVRPAQAGPLRIFMAVGI